MYKAVLIRNEENENQTLGSLFLFFGFDLIYQCCTLELPNKNNERNISRIPSKRYTVKPRHSKKYGKHYILENVFQRDYILIHPANYYTQLKGCIAVGADFYDINKDGEFDITSSRQTMQELLELAPDGFNLYILDNEKIKEN